MKRLVIILAALSSACATYDQRIEAIHQAYYGARVPEAVAGLEADVESASDSDVGVLQLELASAYQADGRYADAALALSRVDDGLEVLDYTTNAPEDVAAFALASELQTWKASPPERLLLNTEAMIDYLLLGDLEDAQVEARKARTLLSQADVAEEDRYPNAFVNALGGFCMDMSNNAQERADFWNGLSDNPLAAKGRHQAGTGTLLVVAQLGKAPIRRDGTFGVWCGDVPQYLRVPVLVDRGDAFRTARVSVDGTDHGQVPAIFDLGAHLMQRFDDELPVLMAAAATQAVARGIVAEGVRAGVAKDDDSQEDDFLASILSWFTSAGLAAMQAPDTRCWSLTPQTLGALRLDGLSPGTHTVRIDLSGNQQRSQEYQVDIPADGFAVVNVVSDLLGGYELPPRLEDVDARDMPAAQAALAIICDASVEMTN